MTFVACAPGCCNVSAHDGGRATKPAGMYRGTRECSEWIGAVFERHSSGTAGIGKLLAIIMLPFSLMDWPFEVVADAITFPYDFGVWVVSGNDGKKQVRAVPHVEGVGNPIPLFVKRVGEILPGHAKDIFPEGKDTLQFDMMKGEYLPPVGGGEVADVEFTRMPREDFGEFVGLSGCKGRSYRDSMGVKFLGDGNGLVEMSYPEAARLKIRTAPETGYRQDYLCWDGVSKQLRDETSYDKGRCFCFRIRTRKNEKGEMVEAYYGKIYRDISFCGDYDKEPIAPVSAVNFLYYLNPTSLDRNLEWNNQNLCEDPLYPRPEKRRRQEYESFNRNQKP